MAGFQRRTAMVSKWCTRLGRDSKVKGPRQSKIYTESNQSDFSQILDDLSALETSAIYRPLLVMNQLRDQTATTSKETVGVARCFFCFAWRFGSGWCWCCC